MRNIVLTTQYDGTNYIGWQRQPLHRGVSIQQTLEQALERVLGHEAALWAAGRTDAGVHALAQWANFSTTNAIPCQNLAAALNHILPSDIKITQAQEVPAAFHARRSAVEKTYRYLIAREKAPLFTRRYLWELGEELDVAAMKEAVGHLLGEHDFFAMSSRGSSAQTSVRTIISAQVLELASLTDLSSEAGLVLPWQQIAGGLVIEITANGFLYKMMRHITARLVEVGRGREAPSSLAGILRGEAAAQIDPAPPQGLTLWHIKYESFS